MPIIASIASPPSISADWLGIPLFDEDAPPASLAGTPVGDLIARLLGEKLISTGVGDTTPIVGAEGLGISGIQAVGLGKPDKADAGAAYAAGVALAKRLAGKIRDRVAVVLPQRASGVDLAGPFIQGLIVGQVGIGTRRAEPGRYPFGQLELLDPGGDEARLRATIDEAEILGNAVNLARDLVNLPPAEKSPSALADRIRSEAEAAGLNVVVWDEAKIEAENFGGLLAVAAGSDNPPRFVVLDYRNGGDAPPVALVGKGVTFDSGGLSLKPSASMEDMKCDMAGAAAVVGALTAVARLGLPVNAVGYLPITENMTGGRAMKLGDVLTMRNGKTVEVLNTDAEGRLILADALSFAVEGKPRLVIDLATLTGAILAALGTKIAGLFANDQALADALLSACSTTGERAWRMPLDDDFGDSIKGGISDIKNVGARWGGSVIAAKFLEHFVGETPWAHLDIAGSAWAESDSATRDAGGTGSFVRTLVAYLAATAPTPPTANPAH